MKWESVKLETIGEQIRGVSYKPSDVANVYSDGYTALYRANNITEKGVLHDDLVYVKNARISQKQKLKVGDILIAASSGSKNIVGKAVYIDIERTVSFGAFCKVVRPIKNRVAHKYLGYYFQSPVYRKKISHLSAGANINNIRKEDISNLEVPLPPFHVQEQIVDTLDKADALRRKDQELLAKYELLAQAIFYDMFGDPMNNEKEWDIKPVIDVADCIVPGRDKPKSFTGNIAWITTEDIQHLGFTNKSKKNIGLTVEEIKQVKAKIIPKNSVIMTCVGDLGMISVAETTW